MKPLILLLSFALVASAAMTSESDARQISNFRRSATEPAVRRKRFTDWETMIMRTKQKLKNDDEGKIKLVHLYF